MRVFHLIKSLGRGGAEVLLTDGPPTSDPQRFQYGFGYFVPHKNAVVPELEGRFGQVICFPATSAAGMLAQTARLAQHLRSWKADLLHCHLPLAGVVGRLAATLAKVPVVYTEHNSIERYHSGTRLLAKATWRLQAHVIAVSADVKSSVHRHLGERIPVTIVRNGVSLERFAPDLAARATLRASLGIAEHAFVVGLVAVFRKQKRLDLWLEAAAALARSQPEARFLLIGDGPLKEQVEIMAKGHGLFPKLVMPGLQTDVRPYLASLDAFMMSSDFEGVPVALLEAMATGVVPIVTNAGGMAEVVTSNVSGFVVPKGSAQELHGALTRLHELPSHARQAMAGAAREKIAEGFSIRRMMTQVEDIYESAVQH